MRSYILFAAVGLLATGSAFGIQDANGNGMSDVWERKFNAGALFSSGNASLAANADPDHDGWTNAQEAVAGTDPFSANFPEGRSQTDIVGHPDLDGVFTISWPSIEGKVYSLKVSPDLVNWVDFGETMAGTGSDIQIAFESGFQDGTIPDSLFFRLSIDDEDPDGDGLTTWEELALGLNPKNPDTDLDGIPDNNDPSPLASATANNPDGLNLPASISNNLLAYWNFEAESGFPAVFPDVSGHGTTATSGLFGAIKAGMPSKAAQTGGINYVWAPITAMPSGTYSNIWTISGWFKIGKGEIANSGVDGAGYGNYKTIYAFYNQIGISAKGDPLGQGNGLLVRKSPQGENWRIGGYKEDVYFHEPPAVDGNAKTVIIGVPFNRPAGSTDDGQWHHFVVTRTTDSYGQEVFIDGVSQLKAAPQEYPVSDALHPEHCKLTFGRLYPGHSISAFQNASVDRIRVHTRVITPNEISALYHQDIDNDGLWDITEVKTGVWRDANGNGLRDGDETFFVSSPFLWQPANHDSDGDGLSDSQEQSLGTNMGNADSDGDLMPDGWEYYHGLNPLSPSDAFADPDADGLNNLNEWIYNTDPHNPNSDGGDPSHPDPVNDGAEVAIGANPSDPTDGGQAPAPEEKLTINLGVGDQSGSHSEDYIMNCYEIDRETGEERRIYTLRSGGFGQYQEKQPGIFRKGHTYTFQIQWQGTNNKPSTAGTPAEGPDFDYTFKVEQQGDLKGGVIVDSWDPQKKEVDSTKPLLATEANDVAVDPDEFKQNFTNRRVALIAPKLEWVAVEGYDNISPHLDPWSGAEKGKRIFPDYKNPGENRLLHAVKLVAKGGLPGTKINVRSYDIDDSTSKAFDRDFETGVPIIDTNGDAGNDNLVDYLNTAQAGHFWNSTLWGDSNGQATFDANGQANFIFRVGMQPGSNYRVVASPINMDGFTGVQVDNIGSSGYLGPEPGQDAGKIASEPLTVWRRLWVENDSMAAIPIDAYGFKDNDISQDLAQRVVRVVRYDAALNETQFVVDEPLDQSSAMALENGLFVIEGNAYNVLSCYESELSGKKVLYVQIAGNHSSIAVGTAFKLYDDDDYGLLQPPLPRLNLVNPLFKKTYIGAFLEITDATEYNPHNIIPFYRNYPENVAVSIPGIPRFDPGMWLDSLDLEGNNELWVANVVAAYQGDTTDDGDPLGEKLSEGGTAPTRRYSVVYTETVRDTSEDLFRSRPDLWPSSNQELQDRITLTACHEIGHQPGGGNAGTHHSEGGLMGEQGYADDTSFKPVTIKRFRGTVKWQQP